jgi:hypothetical protein
MEAVSTSESCHLHTDHIHNLTITNITNNRFYKKCKGRFEEHVERKGTDRITKKILIRSKASNT